MVKKRISCALIILMAFGIVLPLSAQKLDESFRIKLESTLYRFKNYRFSNISVWRLKTISELTKAIQTKDKKAAALAAGKDSEGGVPDCLKNADELLKSKYETGVQKNQTQSTIERDLVVNNIPLPDKTIRDCIYNYFKSKKAVAVKRPKNGYIVTTRIKKGEIVPGTIIGLIVSYEDEPYIDKNIDRPSPQDVYTYDELKQFELDPKEFGADNLYDLMITSFMQNNIENKTAESQGIGTLLSFAPKVHGDSKTLISNEADVSSQDIQSFMRISDGQPEDYLLKENEIVVSPDLIRWRRYQLQVQDKGNGELDTVSQVTNRNLPVLGIEVKYGIDEINYPSLWSERMSASALWENVKLGLILPTNGWSAMTKDAFNVERQLTYAGMGITGEADFPIKVIRNSGIFHVSAGYVFGDAKESDYKNRSFLDVDNYDAVYPTLNDYYRYDYLIRANAEVHYTFGITIDSDYLMRFGIGGTMYNVEKWTLKPDADRENLNLVKDDDETIGGISGRIEFMSRNIVTPWGGSLQYFDESILGSVWLQIPVVKNTFALRLDVKGYFTAFKSNKHPWENDSVFIPMVRAIVNF